MKIQYHSFTSCLKGKTLVSVLVAMVLALMLLSAGYRAFNQLRAETLQSLSQAKLAHTLGLLYLRLHYALSSSQWSLGCGSFRQLQQLYIGLSAKQINDWQLHSLQQYTVLSARQSQNLWSLNKPGSGHIIADQTVLLIRHIMAVKIQSAAISFGQSHFNLSNTAANRTAFKAGKVIVFQSCQQLFITRIQKVIIERNHLMITLSQAVPFTFKSPWTLGIYQPQAWYVGKNLQGEPHLFMKTKTGRREPVLAHVVSFICSASLQCQAVLKSQNHQLRQRIILMSPLHES